jgi:predicted nucleic acid-binding protein
MKNAKIKDLTPDPRADFIVSGDKDLCDVVAYRRIRIIKASDLVKMCD